MRLAGLDLSARGKARIVVLTILGTMLCIGLALAIDSYSFSTGVWTLQDRWLNNVIIPLVVAPPFFAILLVKLRELAIAHHELMIVASTDSLTSCLTRRAFTALVDGYMERLTQDTAKQGALLVVDVDHFKSVNDRFGHDIGDDALKSVAQAIRTSVREIDLVGRMGGEEFSVFLPGLNPKLTDMMAERIRTAVMSVDFRPNGEPFTLAVSVGGTTFDEKASFTELFREADERLYHAKRSGRNRVAIKRYRGGTLLH